MSAACLACGSGELEDWTVSKDVEYFTVPDEFAYRRCRECDALSIDPVPSDRLAEIYPGNYYSFDEGSRSWVTRVKESLDRRGFRKLLAGIEGDELAVLDVGGGSGYLLDQVRRCDPRVRFTQVVDFDQQAEQLARERGHEYFCGRIEDFAGEQRFDFILLLNLVEHVADPGGVLSQARDLLKPGGRILLKTPNCCS